METDLGVLAQQIKARLDLREYANRRLGLHKHTKDELEGPCPSCGGNKRCFYKRDFYHCRECGDGGSVIDFVMQLQHCDLAEAIEFLAGEAGTTLPPVPPAPSRQHRSQPADALKGHAWVAERHLLHCQMVLASGDNEGTQYLASRALKPETWHAYGLGYDAARRAIAMPWYRGGRLSGIRYRSVVPDVPKAQRLTSEKGSSFRNLLFGAQALTADWHAPLPNGFDPLARRRLFIVEGEINAMSVWQAAYGAQVDVLSFGSEAQPIPPPMLPICWRYGMVVCWKDEEARARAAQKMLPGHAAAYWSENTPEEGGGKSDANDLLRAGTLWPTLREVFASLQKPGDEALYWDVTEHDERMKGKMHE